MIERLIERLRAAGCVFAEDEAALLTEAAAGDAAALDELVERRVAGHPIEYLVGWAMFAGSGSPLPTACSSRGTAPNCSPLPPANYSTVDRRCSTCAVAPVRSA
ncbi:hypothetical protein [Dactylosporangium cerinum]